MIALRPTDPEKRKARIRRMRERQREAVKRYQEKVKRETLAGERTSKLDRSTRIPPVNRERRERERERAYGPEARRRWVKSIPCIICRKLPVDQAHVPSKSGMGRKGDASNIVPLCSGPTGHHAQQHEMGVESFERLHGISLAEEARAIEEAWQQKRAS